MNKYINLYKEESFAIKQFMLRLVNFFQDNPVLHNGELPCVHSVKSRMKSEEHLREKIQRKISEGKCITEDNFFDSITDLAGIRVLHLYMRQVKKIHEVIMGEIDRGEWVLFEKPKAYTWDIDSKTFYEKLGMIVEIKPSYYTSIHYVVMPKEGSRIKCELQVRTLWEEAWGELEHYIKYKNIADTGNNDDQLKVLAQIAGAGVKLSDSIIGSTRKESEPSSK